MGLSILHKVLRYSYPVFLLHYLNNLLDKVCKGCYIHSIMIVNHIDILLRKGDNMKVKTEACWNGGNCFYFRCILPNGARFNVPGETWTRKQATEALNHLEYFYNVNRRTVRFI